MNMRKIIAVLSAVLMLCAIIPMGVFAADGDVVYSEDFNDGASGFNHGAYAAEGPDGSTCFVWTAAGDWGCTEAMTSGIQANTDYTVTFKAKGSVAGGMGTTIQDGNWDAWWNGPSFQVTTSWKEYTLTFNSASYVNSNGKMLFKFQDVGVAMDLYVDDLVISEGLPKVPLCENGDFENGKEGWGLSQSTVIDATAAHSGNYGAHLIANANYNTVMERTFAVEAGKKYELSFWAKAVSSGNNIKFLDQNWQGAALASGIWFNETEWTQQTVTFTAASDKFYFQFCGAGAAASELYVDDVTLIEVKDPSFDGYITNGDFETGKLGFPTSQGSDPGVWYNLWGGTSHELVAGYNSDYALKGTASDNYNITYQNVAVEPNTDYTVCAFSKDSSNSALWIKNAGGNGDITNVDFNSGSDWGLTTLNFNSGSNSTVWVGLMGKAAGATYTVDNLMMFEKAEMSNDGYILNGTFEIGDASKWQNTWSNTITVVTGGKDSIFAMNVISGQWQLVRQLVSVEAGATYKLSAWGKDVNNMTLLVKDGNDGGNMAQKGFASGSEWAEASVEFNTGSWTSVYVAVMGNAADSVGTFDNIKLELVKCGTCDEAGCLDSTCSKCGSAIAGIGHNYVEGICSACGAEDPNYVPPCEHEYFYPCDPVCMKCYEITNPDATHNITAVEAVEATCDTNGNIAYWYCSDCGSAWADEALTQVTNQMSVVVPAAHTYTDNCDMDCDVCGEWRDAPHNLTTHVEAVVPANCQEEGCSEYWICADCGGCFQYNEWSGSYSETNPAWLYYTGEHVRPEGAIVCAIVPCELCGEDTYGESCDRGDAPVCQDAPCVNCGETVWGWGCNYNTGDEETPLPLCQPGTCVYCGTEYEYLYECENGAWAPCQDGECSYGCGKQYPATENHVLENCMDGGYCQVCWSYVEAGEHTYDDNFDTDCNVCGEVREIDAIALISFGGNSRTESQSKGAGLAFKFEQDVDGMAIYDYCYADYENAYIGEYKVVKMGAIASNGVDEVNVDILKLCDDDVDGKAIYAVRVINIPEDKLDAEITVTPYVVILIDGVETTLYGEAQVNTYNGI